MKNQNFKPYYLVLLVLILFAIIISVWPKKQKADLNSLTFVFYNVENLFDTLDEPNKNDEEFTPDSEKEWNLERYNKKLEDLSKVLSSVNENELPEIIGLCEVENKKVVSDLVKTGILSNGKYNIVHHESPDVRGIDCALVYREDEFKVVSHSPIHVEFKDEPDYKTRDILYVKGKTNNNEEFHVFVNHWPSRIGGLEKTEPNRVEVATLLRSKIDSVLNENQKANIVVMGDMNDEPANKSLGEILYAAPPGTENSKLVNLMFPDDLQKKGSYYYSGEWNMLDNLVVSSSLLDEDGFSCVDQKGFVFQQEWMEYKNNEGQISPNRTYGGSNYYGGISDHFPVYFKLER